MSYLSRTGTPGMIAIKMLCCAAWFMTSGCDSPLVREAKEAEADGRFISNDIMQAMYPQSFRAGDPPYLERDFEAGADFICDQIHVEHGRDLCADAEVAWR